MASIINCPNCSETLEIKDPAKAKMAYCKKCNATIDLLTNTASPQSNHQSWPMAPKSQLKLGLEGQIKDITYQVVGRVRYRDTRTYEWWDEWLLLSTSGQYMWLQEDDWDFTLMHKYTPNIPFDPNMVGEYLEVDGYKLYTEDNSSATILFFEGELTWKAEVGESIRYIDAWKGEDTLYSCEWTEREIMYFIGKDVPAEELYNGFNLGKPPPEAYEEDGESEAGESGFQVWTAKLIKGAPFKFCLIAGILAILSAIIVNALGIVVPSGGGNRVIVDKGSYIYGPYKLSKKGAIYRVDAKMAVPKNTSIYCEISLLNKDKETELGWDGDFWHEEGYDGDGHWEESNRSKSAFFVVQEPGTYYIEVTPGKKYDALPNRLKIKLREGVAHNWPLWRMAIFTLIYPGIVLILWVLAHGESD